VCNVWRDTPTFEAICEIDNASLITANTAGYRCSATLNSLIQWSVKDRPK